MKPGAWSCQRGEVLTVGHQLLGVSGVLFVDVFPQA